jgi:hypothetical protein
MAHSETIVGTGEHRHPEPHDEVHFEHTDINRRGTFLTGVAVLAGLWMVAGLLYFYFAFLGQYRGEMSRPPLPVEEHAAPLPPQPRLQESPPNDYQAFLKAEQGQLDHYFWIDKARGRVAIPIEHAMEIVAKKGIPPQKAPPNLKLSEPQAGTRETGFEGKVEPEPR